MDYYTPTRSDDPYLYGNRVAFRDQFAPGDEFGSRGIFIKSITNARGGPNLLSVAREREYLPDPDDAVPYGPGDTTNTLRSLYGVTQYRVAEREAEAWSGATPRMVTGPRFTGSQVSIDPTVLLKVGDCQRCVGITEGVPINRGGLYQRIRYTAD